MDKLTKEEWYLSNDPQILKIQNKCLDYMDQFNSIPHSASKAQKEILKKMMGSIGENSTVVAPFYANWGGKFVYIGDHVYINYHLTCVDDAPIYIDDYVQIGPNCTLAVAMHPLDPEMRKQGYQMNKPIHICKNVWLGANVTVLAGVTIGENSVIGAGSIVTKDIPANVVAYGNPCKIQKSI